MHRTNTTQGYRGVPVLVRLVREEEENSGTRPSLHSGRHDGSVSMLNGTRRL